jgi:hypothetical protein
VRRIGVLMPLDETRSCSEHSHLRVRRSRAGKGRGPANAPRPSLSLRGIRRERPGAW